MSNDLPDKKKGLLSGLGNLLKVKEKDSSVPASDPKVPALRPPVEAASKTGPSLPPPAPVLPEPSALPPPVSAASAETTKPGRAKHFRDEFDVFLSDKDGKSGAKNTQNTFSSAPVSRSAKPQVQKSADLSKEFEFFAKSDKKRRPETAEPAQAYTAKPPAITEPVKPTASSPVPLPPPATPPPSVPVSPAKEVTALVPPPPPVIQKKPVSAVPEKGEPTSPPVVSVAPAQKPASPPPVILPPVPVVAAAVEKKTLPPPVLLSPAVVPEAKKTEPAPVATPPVSAPVTKKADVVPSVATAPTSAPSVPAAKTVPGKAGITKVELDPNRKKRPVVVLPPVEDGFGKTAGSSAAGEKKKSPVLFWAGLVLALLLLGGLGAYIYHITRETTVEVALSTEDLSLSGRPLIVYNFDGQVSQIKRDYSERRAPMEVRLQQIEGDLAAAKADLAGRVEKKRLLTAEIQKLRDSIPLLIADGEKKLDTLWKVEGGNLDKSYADQKELLHKEIEKRASDLGLKYERNKELDALEVAVNAFRLSLYGAAKTVNVDEQRIFSEDILKRWRDFEKDWSRKQLEVKEKAMTIKQAPGPRIQDAEKQIETLKVDLDALNIDLASLQEEVNRRQQDEVEEQEKLREVEKPFLSDLMKVPGNNILRELSAGVDGRLVLANLEKSTDMPPGEYLILVQAQKEDEIYWAIKSFVVSKFEKTDVVITRQDFVPIRKLIQ